MTQIRALIRIRTPYYLLRSIRAKLYKYILLYKSEIKTDTLQSIEIVYVNPLLISKL